MKNNDFSVPRRMSKSAFVVFLCKKVWDYLGVFVVMAILTLKDSEDTSFLGLLGKAFLLFLVIMGIAFLTAFLSYYFKTYYVSGGNLIFKHGVFRRETTTIPLSKIHSMRTQRGFVYRLLDMTGVSFDTLASHDVEFELILDDCDWQALLNYVELQEREKQTDDKDEEQTVDGLPPIPEPKSTRMAYSNLNLLKGAFCQNHFKGMAILGGVLLTLYNKFSILGEGAMNYAFEYLDSHAAYVTYSFTMIALLVVIAYLTTMLLWMGKAFADYYNTELRTDATHLFFEHGLITRRSAQFSFDKVCTTIVKQNFLEKWLNGRTIQLEQAFNISGMDGKEAENNKVKIYGAPSSDNILQWWLGKDYATSDTLYEAHSGRGVFVYTIRMDIPIVIVAMGLLAYYALYIWLVVPVVYLLASLLKGLLAVHRSRITLKNDYLVISSGQYAEVLNYVKYENVECVRMVRTPLTPLFHRVKLMAYTSGSSFTVRSLKIDEAQNIYEMLLCWCRKAE